LKFKERTISLSGTIWIASTGMAYRRVHFIWTVVPACSPPFGVTSSGEGCWPEWLDDCSTVIFPLALIQSTRCVTNFSPLSHPLRDKCFSSCTGLITAPTRPWTLHYYQGTNIALSISCFARTGIQNDNQKLLSGHTPCNGLEWSCGSCFCPRHAELCHHGRTYERRNQASRECYRTQAGTTQYQRYAKWYTNVVPLHPSSHSNEVGQWRELPILVSNCW
jgi:hypothetical protein